MMSDPKICEQLRSMSLNDVQNSPLEAHLRMLNAATGIANLAAENTRLMQMLNAAVKDLHRLMYVSDPEYSCQCCATTDCVIRGGHGDMCHPQWRCPITK